jgi:hypothetical protein
MENFIANGSELTSRKFSQTVVHFANRFSKFELTLLPLEHTHTQMTVWTCLRQN